MEYAFFGLLALCALREYLAFKERRDWAMERRLLMVRVQAPEVAVRMDADRATSSAPRVTTLPYDDDEAFHDLRRELERD